MPPAPRHESHYANSPPATWQKQKWIPIASAQLVPPDKRSWGQGESALTYIWGTEEVGGESLNLHGQLGTWSYLHG